MHFPIFQGCPIFGYEGMYTLVQMCHKKLEEKFGRDSARVGILEGQRMESAEKWEQAEKRYKELLELHPTNAVRLH